MAALESYSPCPCGSGQKYKWCCQKAEPFVERSVRLQETGGVEASRAALDEGLAKLPGNPWLTIRKAILLAREGHTKESGEILRGLIAKNPGHIGAHNFLIRVVIETEGADAGAAQLQQALSSVPAEGRAALSITAQLVGIMLAEEGHVPSALAHLRLAQKLEPQDEERSIAQSLRSIEANGSLSAWMRNPYELSPVPTGIAPEKAEAFAKALGWAENGSWASAASAFETLSADHVPEADRNLGLCRLWLADDASAVAALRRSIATLGDSTEAVDLEALCQIIAPVQGKDLVGHVQLTWSIRDRNGLLKNLRGDSTVDDEGRGPIDPEDPDSPEVDVFALLDRPKLQGGTESLSPGDFPRVEARVTIDDKTAALDLVDDGRLERIRDRFMDVAGSSIPPAHPRTKSLGPVPRMSVALQSEMWMPEGISREEGARLTQAEHSRIIRDVWPDTPMPYLGGRTPRRAARDGNAQVALRAAMCQFETGQEFWRGGVDYAAFRAELGVEPEPAIEPETVEIERLHLSRLHRVPADRLDDTKLVRLYLRARHFVLPLAMERSASELTQRPAIFERGEMDRVAPYADLSSLAMNRLAKDEAFDWLRRGREADASSRNAVRWDFLEIRLRSRSEKPEEWVPQLAVVLDRTRDDREAATLVLTNLVEMGLIRTSPNPDEPGQVLLDTRPLQAVLAQFGPKITTASGRLGVSATQGGIWTPGGSTGGGGAAQGGIWTPGSGSAQPSGGGDKPKLILPGR
ncbi:MAG: motif-containing protein [Planctomycetota bacterium]|nr:motif-containing protein [Planctomycetota bacterium]